MIDGFYLKTTMLRLTANQNQVLFLEYVMQVFLSKKDNIAQL